MAVSWNNPDDDFFYYVLCFLPEGEKQLRESRALAVKDYKYKEVFDCGGGLISDGLFDEDIGDKLKDMTPVQEEWGSEFAKVCARVTGETPRSPKPQVSASPTQP
jgi:hypothetical protein